MIRDLAARLENRIVLVNTIGYCHVAVALVQLVATVSHIILIAAFEKANAHGHAVHRSVYKEPGAGCRTGVAGLMTPELVSGHVISG